MVFSLSQLADFLNTIDKSKIIKSRNKLYYNLPCSFDIETSSFYETKTGVIYSNDDYKKSNRTDGNKKAIMYIWQFAIENNVSPILTV